MNISTINGSLQGGRTRAFTSRFRFIEKNAPNVALTNASPLNALNVQSVTADLSRLGTRELVMEKRAFGARFLSAQKSKWNRLSGLLVNLRIRSEKLQEPLNIRSASSSKPGVADAKAEASAIPGEYQISITRIAKSHELGSSAYDEPGRALGLVGSFRINGWNVDVTAGDSLFALRDKINYGEDENNNGSLDRAEDINQNGKLDVLTAPGAYTQEGYLPPFYYNEDINGNSALDATEDANANLRLDGGSSQTSVRAVVAGDQLVLISDEAADIELRFKDPDRILEKIGFIFRNSASGQTTTSRLNRQTVEPEKALFSVDGKKFAATQNSVNNALEGVSLNLKKSGNVKITLQNDLNLGIIPIVNFAMSYNRALGFLNEVMESDATLGKNRRMQSIYADTAKKFFTVPPAPFGKFRTVADVGITADESKPTAIKQAAFQQLPRLQTDRLALPGPGKYSFTNRAERMGVNSSENFKIRLKEKRVTNSLLENSPAMGALLDFAAGRLQKRLDVNIQPEYGTIKFQKNIADFYIRNRAEAEEKTGRMKNVIESKLKNSHHKNLFRYIA